MLYPRGLSDGESLKSRHTAWVTWPWFRIFRAEQGPADLGRERLPLGRALGQS